MNTYSTTKIKDNKYVVAQVEEREYDIIPLTRLGIITHVGGNGRFMFTIPSGGNKGTYQTEFTRPICYKVDSKGEEIKEVYYSYEEVTFDLDIKEFWGDLYIFNDSKAYWKPVELSKRYELVLEQQDKLNEYSLTSK